jgi:hypothetical protein
MFRGRVDGVLADAAGLRPAFPAALPCTAAVGGQVVVSVLLGLLAAGHLSAAASYEAQQKALVMESPSCRVELDGRTGALLRLGPPKAPPLCLGNADGNFWRLGFRDGSWLAAAGAAQAQPLQARCDAATHTLTLTWQAQPAQVRVVLQLAGARVRVQATVFNLAAQPVLTLALPNELALSGAGLRLLTWPESVGLGLTRQWLEKPSGPSPSRWEDQPLGDRLMRRLLGFGAQMLPLPGTPKPARFPPQATARLGAEVTRPLSGLPVTVLRPPEGQPDLVFMENDDGPYLVGFKRGAGWFVYFAGPSEERVATGLVPALLRALAPQRAAGRKVGLVALRGREHGGWMDVALSTWRQSLPSAIPAAEVTLLRSAAALRAALADEKVAAIFNPYAERLPADSLKEAEALVDALRSFLQRGGLWLDAGGYPFYYLVRRRRFGRLAGRYPPLFCDFLHLDSQYGQLAVYRVQPEQEVFVPAHLEVHGAEVGARQQPSILTSSPPGSRQVSSGRHRLW